MDIPKNDNVKALYKAILALENEDECARFFDDLCTIKEIRSLAQRYEIAELADKKMTYQEICDKTGASTATVGRVYRCVTYSDGYRTIINRLREDGAGKDSK